MGVKKQYYGIKFPFTMNNNEGIYLDLNNDYHEKVASEIAHVLLTPKGTRIRMPEFGTDLIKYVFEPSDSFVWDDVKDNIKDNVTRYVPNATIKEIEVIRKDDDNSLFVDLKFDVRKGKSIENNRMIIKL
jgi:phage baseplate assembly protein W